MYNLSLCLYFNPVEQVSGRWHKVRVVEEMLCELLKIKLKI